MRMPRMNLTPPATAAVAALIILVSDAPGADRKAWKDSSVQAGDIKMRYLEAGTGDRAVVFITDLAMIAEVWREQIPYFTSRGYRVLAIDPRSQGGSSKTDNGNSALQQAADLHEFLKAVKAERAALVAWGFGVQVVVDYLSSPDSIMPDRVVFVDGVPIGHQAEDFSSGTTLQRIRNTLTLIQQDRQKWTEGWIRGMFRTRPQEILVKEMQEGSLKTPSGALLAQIFDLYTGDWRLALARISVPTLVVVPDTSRIVGEYIQGKVKRARLEVVPEAGHALFLEKPQYFNQVLEGFLDGK